MSFTKQGWGVITRHYWTSNLWYIILCRLALIGSNPCSQFYWKSWVTCTGFPRCLPGESIIVAGANKAVGWWSWRFPWGIYCFPTSALVVPKIVWEAKMSNTRTRNWGSLGTLQPPDAFINGNIESKPLAWTRLNRKHLKELHRFEKPRLNYTRIMNKVKYGRERNVSVPEAYHIICQT